MVEGRVIAEALIASTAGVILVVILGLRAIMGTGPNTAFSSNGFLRFATSELFLVSLFVLIMVGIAAVEIYYRSKRGGKTAVPSA